MGEKRTVELEPEVVVEGPGGVLVDDHDPGMAEPGRDAGLMLEVAAALLAIYLFHCLCCSRICKKAGSEPGILVWIPVLQLFPLLRAAGMSGWWFLAFFVPVLNLIAQILWCFKIADARGKTALVGFLLGQVGDLEAVVVGSGRLGAEPPQQRVVHVRQLELFDSLAQLPLGTFDYGTPEPAPALSAERAYEKAAAEAKEKGLPPPERVFERVNGEDRAR